MASRLGAQLFYGLVLDGDPPWGEADPYYWWAELHVGPKPDEDDKEAVAQWRDDCLNFNSRTLIECGHCGPKENPKHIVYVKASLVMSIDFDFKKVNLSSLAERYSPGWDQALREFCVRARVLWDPDRVGWNLAADTS